MCVCVCVCGGRDWSALNARAIANLVNDFGFDGVDIDYEPSNPNCQRMGGTVRCSSDANFISVIDQLRGALPQGTTLSPCLPHIPL